MLRDLREQAGECTPFLWWRCIDNAVRGAVDPDAIRGRGDFSAELMQTRAALADDHERRRTWLSECWQALADRSVARYVAPLAPDDEARVLDAAERLALQLLDDEDAP
jgi:hypothetical protein